MKSTSWPIRTKKLFSVSKFCKEQNIHYTIDELDYVPWCFNLWAYALQLSLFMLCLLGHMSGIIGCICDSVWVWKWSRNSARHENSKGWAAVLFSRWKRHLVYILICSLSSDNSSTLASTYIIISEWKITEKRNKIKSKNLGYHRLMYLVVQWNNEYVKIIVQWFHLTQFITIRINFA